MPLGHKLPQMSENEFPLNVTHYSIVLYIIVSTSTQPTNTIISLWQQARLSKAMITICVSYIM